MGKKRKGTIVKVHASSTYGKIGVGAGSFAAQMLREQTLVNPDSPMARTIRKLRKMADRIETWIHDDTTQREDELLSFAASRIRLSAFDIELVLKGSAK